MRGMSECLYWIGFTSHLGLMDSGLDWMDGGDCVSFKCGFIVTRERDIISQPAKAAIIKARV